MDAKQAQLEEKLAKLLKQAAEVASQLQAVEQGPGVPHYDQIEIPAHQAGQRLSRMIQSERSGDIAADQQQRIDCPDCGQSCRIETKGRPIQSMDGSVDVVEPIAHCRRCRRSFFPSA